MTYPSGDVRDQLAYLGRAVVRAGLVVGSGGNLSARAGTGTCWVTAAGTWLDRLDRDAFALLRIADGAVLSAAALGGAPAPPSSEFALHLAAYRARPDAGALAHLHPQTLILLDALGYEVAQVTTDHAHYLGSRVARTPYRPPGGAELAELAGAAHRDADFVVLAHHGCSVLGTGVADVHRRVANLAEAAELTYRALLLTGDPTRVPGCPDPDPVHQDPVRLGPVHHDPGQPDATGAGAMPGSL